MGHGGKPKKGESAIPYVLSACVSGVMEVFLFHPVDTTAKRLMSNTQPIFSHPEKGAGTRLSEVVFAKAHGQPLGTKVRNMFPGISFGAYYKILQRTYKFGAQMILKNAMQDRFGGAFANRFGDKLGKDMISACSGSLVGLGEVALLPLDLLKIKAQTNPEALQGRGVLQIFKQEGLRNMYAGWNWTALRNMPGSFALFGATSFTYTWLFNTDPKKATFAQTCAGSIIGGTSSILVSSPMDVIKVRIQNKPFDDPRGGLTIIKDAIRQEGPGAFFKGLGPKVGLIGPKLFFSWTIAQYLGRAISESWEAQGKK